MRHPQIVVFETDGWLAAQVADIAREHGWLVRESRHPESCLHFLRESRPAVLLLKLGPKLLDELTLLSQVNEIVPDCHAIVFSHAKMESAQQRANVASLAYDLGARHVMFPPLTKTAIEDIVAGLMTATIERSIAHA